MAELGSQPGTLRITSGLSVEGGGSEHRTVRGDQPCPDWRTIAGPGGTAPRAVTVGQPERPDGRDVPVRAHQLADHRVVAGLQIDGHVYPPRLTVEHEHLAHVIVVAGGNQRG